jgi:hypothetical protein
MTRLLQDETQTHDSKGCTCHRCIEEFDLHVMCGKWKLPLSSTRMILCPTCGNKRCPHASDHRLACTDSNESGQPGSVYPAINYAEVRNRTSEPPLSDQQVEAQDSMFQNSEGSSTMTPLVAFAKSIEADRTAFESWADALPDCLPPAPKAAAWKAWQAAIAHERQACADLCERLVRDDSDAGECADAIRARGLHTEEGERG